MNDKTQIEAILFRRLRQIKWDNLTVTTNGYYNEQLSDISSVLAALLGIKLHEKNVSWIDINWLDDCLIVNVDKRNEICSFEGVMIYGKEITSEQWVSPFQFKTNLENRQYSFLFGYNLHDEVSYHSYREHQDIFNIKIRDWQFILNS